MRWRVVWAVSQVEKASGKQQMMIVKMFPGVCQEEQSIKQASKQARRSSHGCPYAQRV